MPRYFGAPSVRDESGAILTGAIAQAFANFRGAKDRKRVLAQDTADRSLADHLAGIREGIPTDVVRMGEDGSFAPGPHQALPPGVGGQPRYLDASATPEARSDARAQSRLTMERNLARTLAEQERTRRETNLANAGIPANQVGAAADNEGLARALLEPRGVSGALYPIVGPDGSPVYQDATGARGRRPYREPRTSDAGDPRRLQRGMLLQGRYSSGAIPKQAESIAQAYDKVRVSAAGNSAASDMALLYGFMKLQDPDSAVRESEFAAAAQSGSLGERMQGFVTKLASGQRLTPDQRADFVRQAESLARSHQAMLQRENERWTAIAQRNDVDPADVVADPYDGMFVAPAATTPVTTEAGDLQAALDEVGVEQRRDPQGMTDPKRRARYDKLRADIIVKFGDRRGPR